MTNAEAKRWLAQRRAAEARGKQVLRDAPLGPEGHLRQGLAAIAFYASVHGWPVRVSVNEAQEDLALMQRWATLRRRLGSAP